MLANAAVGDGGFGDFESQNLTTQECLRQSEGMYSSIMDYMGTWNADLNGLGTYDYAATKFAYGQLLEVFPEDNLTGITALQLDVPQQLKMATALASLSALPLRVGRLPRAPGSRLRLRSRHAHQRGLPVDPLLRALLLHALRA